MEQGLVVQVCIGDKTYYLRNGRLVKSLPEAKTYRDLLSASRARRAFLEDSKKKYPHRPEIRLLAADGSNREFRPLDT